MMIAAKEAHSRDGRGFGKLLGDTVSQAVQTLMMTGGYMIGFAVFIRLVSLYLTLRVLCCAVASFLRDSPRHLSFEPDFINTHAAHVSTCSRSGMGWFMLPSASLCCLETTGPGSKSMLYFAGVRLAHAIVAFFISLFLWMPFSRYSTEVSTTLQTNAEQDLSTPFGWLYS